MSSSEPWNVIPDAQIWTEAQENAARTYQDFHLYDGKMTKESVVFMLHSLLKCAQLGMWCYPHKQEQALLVVQNQLAEQGANYTLEDIKAKVEKLYTRYFCYNRILTWPCKRRGCISFSGGRNRVDLKVWAEIMAYDCHAKWYYVVDEPLFEQLKVLFKKCKCQDPVTDAARCPPPVFKDIPIQGEGFSRRG